MKRNLASLAAVAASAGPYLPAVLVGFGLVAVLAWALTDGEREPAPVPTAPEPPSLPPPDDRFPRSLSGQFAPRVCLSDLRAVFAGGPLSRAEAVAALTDRTGCSRSAAYHVLGRRFAIFTAQGPDGQLRFTA